MGQTIISAGLIIIVTIAVINANRLVINAETSKMEGLARLHAADIAQALITEARMKKFDENAITSTYQLEDAFTASAALGPESGESTSSPDTTLQSASRFDDFDDYNNYFRRVTVPVGSQSLIYDVRVEVFYATQNALDTKVSVRSYIKTMKVSISHATYLPIPITMSFTNSY